MGKEYVTEWNGYTIMINMTKNPKKQGSYYRISKGRYFLNDGQYCNINHRDLLKYCKILAVNSEKLRLKSVVGMMERERATTHS